ncbi:MAG: hypothetical protein E7422_01560 [Ruminococcaceae bacterium]|jgi:hypothetical protein|nr:hypothetical protein [Oscillospiraceae bacterium]
MALLPYDETPMAHARFGQPEDAGDLLNQYGTYNIQPTNEQENAFPMIMQALPTQWRGMKIHREDLQTPSL